MKYTLKHWVAYQIVAIKFLLWRPRHLLHDVDKLIIRIMYGEKLDDRELQNIHRNNNTHHIRRGEVTSGITKKRAVDMFIDWECARYTKPDKPLNALKTLHKYYADYVDVLEPHFKKFLK